MGSPASIPANSRRLVPELPQSRIRRAQQYRLLLVASVKLN